MVCSFECTPVQEPMSTAFPRMILGILRNFGASRPAIASGAVHGPVLGGASREGKKIKGSQKHQMGHFLLKIGKMSKPTEV